MDRFTGDSPPDDEALTRKRKLLSKLQTKVSKRDKSSNDLASKSTQQSHIESKKSPKGFSQDVEQINKQRG